MEHDCVAILDAGAQYGKVIDRKVRELGVATELLPLDCPATCLGRYTYVCAHQMGLASYPRRY